MKWLDLFPEPLKTILINMPLQLLETLEEVRIREERPLEINTNGEHYFVTQHSKPSKIQSEAYKPSRQDTHRFLDLISNHSLYTMEEELRKGFITIPGGHRIGLAGRTVLKNGRVEHLRDISGFNVRIAKEVNGAADRLLPHLVDHRTSRIKHTLIVSPPQQGKTTLLRDLARQISHGNEKRQSYKVGIVDERSEIAGSYKGVPTFDVGPRTDVMDACPKAEGMMMLIRSMSPEVLIVDEIGRDEDAEAIKEALNAGISVIASAHGRDMADLSKRPFIKDLIQEEMFQLYVMIDRSGKKVTYKMADSKHRAIQQQGITSVGGSYA
ncbi:stage III sporulation protein AA [Paenibacillus sp. Marseille-Q4541]|uniref:stage III sporulation protein AA n=1 Tax=Paenibacillus sp. Marseille-Q4541 TaxID=2831522 RepID=UPI001BAB5C52|nr:stage III sporulation protein AA [Paenibacillus sp. Marseille-Q4541]